MKKTSLSIMYDDEKLNAIKLYMSQRDLDFKEELEKSVDSLYAKYVPANVREFIDMKSTISKQTKKKSIDALSNQSAEVEFIILLFVFIFLAKSFSISSNSYKSTLQGSSSDRSLEVFKIDLIMKYAINNIIIIIKISQIIAPNLDRILEASKIKLQMALPNIPNISDINIL